MHIYSLSTFLVHYSYIVRAARLQKIVNGRNEEDLGNSGSEVRELVGMFLEDLFPLHTHTHTQLDSIKDLQIDHKHIETVFKNEIDPKWPFKRYVMLFPGYLTPTHPLKTLTTLNQPPS